MNKKRIQYQTHVYETSRSIDKNSKQKQFHFGGIRSRSTVDPIYTKKPFWLVGFLVYKVSPALLENGRSIVSFRNPVAEVENCDIHRFLFWLSHEFQVHFDLLVEYTVASDQKIKSEFKQDPGEIRSISVYLTDLRHRKIVLYSLYVFQSLPSPEKDS